VSLQVYSWLRYDVENDRLGCTGKIVGAGRYDNSKFGKSLVRRKSSVEEGVEHVIYDDAILAFRLLRAHGKLYFLKYELS
jgi:hypothetical protein